MIVQIWNFCRIKIVIISENWTEIVTLVRVPSVHVKVYSWRATKNTKGLPSTTHDEAVITHNSFFPILNIFPLISSTKAVCSWLHLELNISWVLACFERFHLSVLTNEYITHLHPLPACCGNIEDPIWWYHVLISPWFYKKKSLFILEFAKHSLVKSCYEILQRDLEVRSYYFN